jgi:antitoxin YefM
MNTLSLDEASQQFGAVVAKVLADAEPTVVNTPSGASVGVAPLGDFEAWRETAYLLRSPANAAHLRRLIGEAEAGKVQPHELVD